MTTDVEKLVVSMSADFKSYERAFAKAQALRGALKWRIKQQNQAIRTSSRDLLKSLERHTLRCVDSPSVRA
jgi:hypothetical protein